MSTFTYFFMTLSLILIGPEATAKNLPMKKVRTVVTEWIPEDSEPDEEAAVIETVEIPENAEGAVPVFPEGQTHQQEIKKPEHLVKIEEHASKMDQEDKRPIIQVIYESPKKEEAAKAEEMIPQATPVEVAQKVEEKKEEAPQKVKSIKVDGDTYNFYFNN